MGDWNETCGVTNMAIKEGENIICFIIKKSKDFIPETLKQLMYTNTDDIYNPVSIGFRGVYDGYGLAADVDREVQDLISQNFIDEIKNGECLNLKDIYSDIDKEYQGIFLELLRDISGKSDRYELFFVKELIYDNLISAARERINTQNLRTSLIIQWNMEKYMAEKDLIEELLIFNECLRVLRKDWIPKSGKGSFNNELFLHGIVADFVKDEIERNLDEIEDITGERHTPNNFI